MEQKYSTFTFCRDDYEEENKSTGRRELNEYMMFEDIKEFIRLSIKNGYQCRIWDDGLTICVEYNYLDPDYGIRLEWLSEDEYVESFQKEDDE